MSSKNKKCNRALFLDRDGVINIDHAYVYLKEDFEFIDGVFELCRHAVNLNYLIFVITNQAGIGRGYYTEKDFWDLTNWMTRIFSEEGIEISKVYFCPFHSEHGVGHYKIDSPDRKPAPGMILKAVEEFDVDVESSILIGDKLTDIQAGVAAGMGQNILYTPSNDIVTEVTVINNLIDAESFFK